MNHFTLKPIGQIVIKEEGMFVQLLPEYIPALQALEGFSHLDILWWFDACDQEAARRKLTVVSPYRLAPQVMGTFATRSPERPNPLALSVARILAVDERQGLIQLDYIDAAEGSPVLDLKPYTPSLDRVEAPRVPHWCSHWPKSVEQSGEFDWESEFCF